MNGCGDTMDPKAEALSAAKQRIVALQSQMTNRILELAGEVEKLLEVVTDREAREFLRASCNLPSSELTTYVRFAKTLKGHEPVLAKARVSFPVVKAIVAADPEARREIVERLEIGARIDDREVAAIRKRLRDAKLTPSQILGQRNKRLVTAAARARSAGLVSAFQEKVRILYAKLWGYGPVRLQEASRSESVRLQAAGLLEEFACLFGDRMTSLDGIKGNSPHYVVPSAHHALARIAEGRFGSVEHYVENGTGPRSDAETLSALHRMTGQPVPTGKRSYDGTVLTDLPPFPDRLRVLELCAGAGGMGIGLEKAGFRHMGLIEADKHAAATLRRNRPDWPVIEEDVRKIDFRPYRKQRIALVTGGLPCQPYSSDGEGLGKDDPRDLMIEGVRVVTEVRPQAFVWENVDGFLHARHGDHVADILRRYRKAGYHVDIHRMKAEDYGIAQERSRVLIVGLRKDLMGAFRMPPKFPDRRTNIGDALVDLMAANGWEGAYEWARARREQPVFDRDGNVISRGVLASTIVTRRGKPREKEAARWSRKCVDIAGLPESAPTAEQASKPGFMPALTARMRARLQDFPDHWEFMGGKQSTADQIGNAVPPRLAQAVGLALFSAIKGVTWDMEAVLWPEKAARTRVEAPPLQPELGSAVRLSNEVAI